MDELSAFLAAVVPWPEEGDKFYVGVYWIEEGREGRKFWKGRGYRTVPECVGGIKWVQRLADARDIYICMSGQTNAEPRVAKTGSGFRYVNLARGQEYASGLRSLFLDVDVKGGEHGYDSLDDACANIGKFAASMDLPNPTCLVLSGGGVHAHWVGADTLSPAEWRPLALALAEATRVHGLKCDTQVTIDSARVLRPPQTHNYKFDPPKLTRLVGDPTNRIYTWERLRRALAPYIDAAPTHHPVANTAGVDISALSGVKPPAGMDPHSVDGIIIPRESPPINLDAIAEECAFVNTAITTGGKDYAEPLWHKALLLTTFCGDNSRVQAHRISSSHPSYTPAETDDKFDRVVREKEKKGLGWPSCDAIYNSGYTECSKCVHFKEKRQPPAFVKKKGEPAAPVSDLPIGFFRNKEAKICRLVPTDTMPSGDLVPIMDYPVIDPWIQNHPSWVINFTSSTEKGVTGQIELPFTSVSANDKLTTALLERGIAVRAKDITLVKDFFMSWITLLQQQKDQVASKSAYGWGTKEPHKEGFAFGGRAWINGEHKPAATAGSVVRRQYEPVGSDKPWRDAVELVYGNPALEVLVAASFGAPLMRFTGHAGCMVSGYSIGSGLGKSTAVEIGLAVWGNPKMTKQKLDDTPLSMLNRMGVLRSLPMAWDEIKGEEQLRTFAKLAFHLTAGVEKNRLNRDLKQQESGSWDTLMVSATNDTVYEHVQEQMGSTPAGLYRIFEFEVKPGGRHMEIDSAEAQRMLSKLQTNHGIIGLEYAKWLGSNFDFLEKAVFQYQQRVANRFSTEERYWQAAISAIVVGAAAANHLGFTRFNIDAMEQFLFASTEALRLHVNQLVFDIKSEGDLYSALAAFFKHMRPHTLVTNVVWRPGTGKPRPGSIQIAGIIDPTRFKMAQIQIGKEDGIVLISEYAMKEWMRTKRLAMVALLRELKLRFGAHTYRSKLGAGTDYQELPEKVIELRVKGTELETLVNAQFDDVGNEAGGGESKGDRSG